MQIKCVWLSVCLGLQILWGVMKAYLVISTTLNCAFFPDDLSSNEGTSEKIELNEDDGIKSQEVRIGFPIDSLRMT